MKKGLLVLVTLCLLVSCTSKKDETVIEYDSVDTTRRAVVETNTTLGKSIVYKGMLPCADCRGIETVLKIYTGDDLHFELLSVYKGKTVEREFTQKGFYKIEKGLETDSEGIIYVLNSDKPHSDHIYYGRTSNSHEKVYLLDGNREIIESNLDYSLTLSE